MNFKNPNKVMGIIGGSGIYEIDGLSDKRWLDVKTPYGEPSDQLMVGQLDGQKIVFLPRHGRGHKISPSEINYRANVYALKSIGVAEIISVSAVGSLRENLSPGMFVIVDQFVDRTFVRKKTFFESGVVAHVSMAHPVCNRLGNHLEQAAISAGLNVVRGGTYLVMEGPQFSTLAESEMYRAWNCDVIGMTNMPEAKLAREAEICYASVAMVTDYDCWHPNHNNVTVEQIIKVLTVNADNARSLVKAVAPKIYTDATAEYCSCRTALEHAVITSPDVRDPTVVSSLGVIADRVLKNK